MSLGFLQITKIDFRSSPFKARKCDRKWLLAQTEFQFCQTTFQKLFHHHEETTMYRKRSETWVRSSRKNLENRLQQLMMRNLCKNWWPTNSSPPTQQTPTGVSYQTDLESILWEWIDELFQVKFWENSDILWPIYPIWMPQNLLKRDLVRYGKFCYFMIIMMIIFWLHYLFLLFCTICVNKTFSPYWTHRWLSFWMHEQ